MADHSGVESAVRMLVEECCPDHHLVCDASPQVVGSADWSKVVAAIQLLVPVVLQIVDLFHGGRPAFRSDLPPAE